MLHEIVSNWEDMLYSCSHLYWSQWDLPGAQYFLKSGHIFRFLNKDFQKDLGSMTLSGQSPNLLFLSQQLWGSFHIFFFFHHVLPSVSGEISKWQPNHHRMKDVRICPPLVTTVPLSSVTSLLFHFTFHIAHVQQSYLSLHVRKTLNVLLKLPSVRI